MAAGTFVRDGFHLSGITAGHEGRANEINSLVTQPPRIDRITAITDVAVGDKGNTISRDNGIAIDPLAAAAAQFRTEKFTSAHNPAIRVAPTETGLVR